MISVFRPEPVALPRDWARTAITRDGVAYRVHVLGAGDEQREYAFLRQLSPESRFFRFLHGVGQPTRELVDALAGTAGPYSMAFAAVTGSGDAEVIVGIARYAADDSSGSCEFALVVADDWQDRGVGSTLLRILFDYARAAGYKHTRGTIHGDNARMVELAHWLGMETHADHDAREVVASRSLD